MFFSLAECCVCVHGDGGGSGGCAVDVRRGWEWRGDPAAAPRMLGVRASITYGEYGQRSCGDPGPDVYPIELKIPGHVWWAMGESRRYVGIYNEDKNRGTLDSLTQTTEPLFRSKM